MSSLLKMVMAAACIAMFGCATPDESADEQASAPADAFSFVVIGDTPYNAADEVMLQEALPKIKEDGYPFVIHIGDYKGGRSPCLQEYDDRHRVLIEELKPIPVFYTPGDNEWTDCDRNKDPATGKHYSALDRLEQIRKLFFSEPVDAPEILDYQHQEQQPENATWFYGGVRFVTLHVTGTNNGRDWVTGDPLNSAKVEAAERDYWNMSWMFHISKIMETENADAVVIAMQADMTKVGGKHEDVMCETVADSDNHPCDGFTIYRELFRDWATELEKPVLLIHGDTAPFTLNQKFAGEEALNLWRLNAAGDTGPTYGTRDVTAVTINPEAAAPFSAQGLLTEKKPKSK